MNLNSQNQPMMRLKSFIVNGEEQKLDNNFDIFFVYEDENEKIIYAPIVKNDIFYYPKNISIPRDTIGYHWLLKHEGKIYYLRHGWLFIFQEMEIVIETKSYKKYDETKWRRDCFNSEESSYNNEGVVYIEWDSYTWTCNPIMGNMKSYLRKGKELLRISNSKSKKKKKQ